MNHSPDDIDELVAQFRADIARAVDATPGVEADELRHLADVLPVSEGAEDWAEKSAHAAIILGSAVSLAQHVEAQAPDMTPLVDDLHPFLQALDTMAADELRRVVAVAVSIVTAMLMER